jgi:hypothetical protein
VTKAFRAVLTLFFLPAFLQAVELKPWYSNDLQLQGFLDYRFQNFPSVNASGKHNHYSSNDSFVTGSLLYIYSPYSVQVETEFADTKKRNFDWDHVNVTGRYLLLDDNIGDPFSLTTGLTLSRAWREAVNDISSFHHGRNEAFLHVSLGKQNIQGSTWLSRWWCVTGIGTADRWTPWVVANGAYEWNGCDPHRFCLYVNSLWGCGKRRLKVHDFGGYGPVEHRSIDLGLRYTHEFDYYGMLSIEYAHRVYAHNFPDHANVFKICYNYPFGPEGSYYILKARTFFSGKKPSSL